MSEVERDTVERAAGAVVERVRWPGVLPVEVGDLLVDGMEFRERVLAWGLGATVRRAIELLHAGEGATRSNGPLSSSVANFDAVLLVGGRARETDLGPSLAGLKPAICFGTEGIFAGESGGFRILDQRGLSGWVLDLGQSQLKLAMPGRRMVFPRDAARLRAVGEVSSQELPAQRRRLREFMALPLRRAAAETCSWPQALVVAIPARLADDGTPETGHYAGLRGYRELIPDMLGVAGFVDVPVFVLNDAELAAVSAGADARLAEFSRILVLTLGFGIGAAVVSRR